MRKTFSLLLTTLLMACATPSPSPVDTTKYQFLFEKVGLPGRDCIAAFDGDGLLYLVHIRGDLGTTDVSIYDPRTSLFANVPVRNRGRGSCRDVVLPSLTAYGSAGLNFIASAGLRRLFDRYRDDPESLKNAINAGPPYFRSDSRWEGQRSALNLDGHRVNDVKTLAEVAKYLKALDDKTAASMIQARQAFVASMDAKQEQQRQSAQRARLAWEDRLAATYRQGDKVCTYDSNFFGYVEDIQKERLKVYVIGRATLLGTPTSKGFFFLGDIPRFEYDRIEAVRWLNRNEVAPCAFDDMPAPGR